MHKITSSFAVLATVLLTVATAQAQTPEPKTTFSLSLGGQVTTRTFSANTSFSDFGETGTVVANQTSGRGFVVDGNVRRNMWGNLGVGVGVWLEHDKGTAAAVAQIPDPLFVGHFTTVSATVNDLAQNVVGINLQVFWMHAIGDRNELVVSLGPSIVHTSQDVGTITVGSNSSIGTPGVASQSATSAKAGNVGIELNRSLNDKYQGGLFVRYAGGEVDLPAVQKLKVGGVQVGGAIRIRF